MRLSRNASTSFHPWLHRRKVCVVCMHVCIYLCMQTFACPRVRRGMLYVWVCACICICIIYFRTHEPRSNTHMPYKLPLLALRVLSCVLNTACELCIASYQRKYSSDTRNYWFVSGIALDECHRAKNQGKQPKDGDKKPKSDKDKGSKTAQLVKLLQETLPLARIIYVSATGASGKYLSLCTCACTCARLCVYVCMYVKPDSLRIC